ncbi:MAG: hypothetical protein FWD74_00670 [Actinomycetia bacterium]|nr:hypothetical protein [Actinomycetes bacterium]
MKIIHNASKRPARAPKHTAAFDLLFETISQSFAAVRHRDVRQWECRICAERGEPVERSVYWSDRLPLAQPYLGQETSFAASDTEQWSSFTDFCFGDTELEYAWTERGGLSMVLSEFLLEHEKAVRRILEHDYVTVVLKYPAHAFMKVVRLPQE